MTKDEIMFMQKRAAFLCNADYQKSLTKTRKRECVAARYIGMLYLLEKEGMTLKKVGEVYNGLDHSTIIYAKKVVYNKMQTNLADNYKKLKKYMSKVKRSKYQHQDIIDKLVAIKNNENIHNKVCINEVIEDIKNM